MKESFPKSGKVFVSKSQLILSMRNLVGLYTYIHVCRPNGHEVKQVFSGTSVQGTLHNYMDTCEIKCAQIVITISNFLYFLRESFIV